MEVDCERERKRARVTLARMVAEDEARARFAMQEVAAQKRGIALLLGAA